MAMGLSGSKGGIKNKEKIISESYVKIFAELIKLNKKTHQNGDGLVW